MNTVNSPRRTSALLMICTLLILGSVALQTRHFDTRHFRQDEINTVHAAQILSISEITQWMGTAGRHPPGWRILGAEWVKLMGEAGVYEPVARYSSTLTMLIALALIYRLAADLFDARTGLLAVFVFGTVPFATFYTHEFRPYALLVLTTAGMMLALVRWLKHVNFRYALLFVIFGMMGLQTHFFAGYVLATLAITLVLLVRWDWGIMLRAAGLFAAIGLSFSVWLIPILHGIVVMSGGLTYALPPDRTFFTELHESIYLAPRALGYALVLFAVAVPVGGSYRWLLRPRGQPGDRFRFGAEWPKLYLLSVAVITLGLAYLSNRFVVDNTTERNLIVLIVPVAVLAAYGLARLPYYATAAALLLILYPAVDGLPNYQRNVPYSDLVDFITPDYQPGDGIITSNGSSQLMYYLLDRGPDALEKTHFFHLDPQGFFVQNDPFVNKVTPWMEPEDVTAPFAVFIQDRDRLWIITRGEGEPELEALLMPLLLDDFAEVRSATIRRLDTGSRYYTITQYTRAAD